MLDLIRRCVAKPVKDRPESLAVVRRLLEEEIALRALPSVAAPAQDVPNNLPAPLTGFIGRDRQKGEVAGLIRDHRLVTLTGVGGGGKTRLAIEIARFHARPVLPTGSGSWNSLRSLPGTWCRGPWLPF